MIAFLAIPAVRNAAIGLAILAAAWAAVAYREHAVYQRGVTDMKSAVESQDAKAVGAAQKAGRSVDECYDAGREWDQVKGVCGE